MTPGTGRERNQAQDDGAGLPALAAAVRDARQAVGITRSELARRAGIHPSYVSRIESAAWEKGGPWPSDDVLRALARVVGCSSTRLIELKRDARPDDVPGSGPRAWSRRTGSARYAVSVGDGDVHRAARRLLERNPPRGSLRLSSQLFEQARDGTPDSQFTTALGRRLAEDTASILYRVCVVAPDNLERVRSTTQRLAVGRDPSTVHNIRTRCCFKPPAMFDVVVGEHEALIAVPDRRGHAYLRASLVIDDPDFVDALTNWFDDFIWEPPAGYVDVRYDRLDEALEVVRERLAAAG